ncbi:MAG: hypothetical protein LBQ41_02195 [Candidatus Ancillula sp.]|nr:hypothetical protein [Candidatus Ancillula sp.]
MRRFEVYEGEVVFEDGSSSKTRPAVIIEVTEDGDDIQVLGVYSYRKWFNKEHLDKRFTEIKDIEVAGLNQRSFVEVNTVFDIPREVLNGFKYRGKLSIRDAMRLVEEL